MCAYVSASTVGRFAYVSKYLLFCDNECKSTAELMSCHRSHQCWLVLCRQMEACLLGGCLLLPPWNPGPCAGQKLDRHSTIKPNEKCELNEEEGWRMRDRLKPTSSNQSHMQACRHIRRRIPGKRMCAKKHSSLTPQQSAHKQSQRWVKVTGLWTGGHLISKMGALQLIMYLLSWHQALVTWKCRHNSLSIICSDLFMFFLGLWILTH